MDAFADVVLGLQFGSEGKGSFCHFLLTTGDYRFSVRTGGPQAGHTVKLEDGTVHPFHAIPVAAVVPGIRLFIPPGGIVRTETVLQELNWCDRRGLDASGRLTIDYEATLLEDKHPQAEKDARLRELLGSTTVGVGAATADRVCGGEQSEPRMTTD